MDRDLSQDIASENPLPKEAVDRGDDNENEPRFPPKTLPALGERAIPNNENMDKVSKTEPLSEMDGLHEVVNHLQQSLGGAYARMSESLTRSMKLMGTMNEMMEGYMRQSVRINSICSFDKQAQLPQVRVRICNKSKIPIRHAEISIELIPVQSEDVICQIFQTSGDDIDLEPDVEWDRRFHIIGQSKEERANIRIRVKFPSPGSDNELSVEHRCGLYQSHQCKMVRGDVLHGCSVKVEGISGEFLRNYLQLDPTEDMKEGNTYSIFRKAADSPIASISVLSNARAVKVSATSEQEMETFADEVTRLNNSFMRRNFSST